MNDSLFTLFSPPDGYFGDFGVFSGMAVDAAVIRKMHSQFMGPSSRPVLAAFIDPAHPPVSHVNGVGWMWMRRQGYNILHAKVAVLGFRAIKGEGYLLRLIICTGNWTKSPLENSIDLFTYFDLHPDKASEHLQECADLQAAWQMFNWLRERADCSLIEREYDGARPDAILAQTIAALPKTDLRPRFIDSRSQPLSEQVLDRFEGIKKKANCLILGSGYFEAEVGTDGGVPERLHKSLLSRKMIKRDSERHIFLNPLSCQGLAGERAAALAQQGWQFRKPWTRYHGDHGKLHAKFILLSGGIEPISGRLYIGSGNLSKQGFELAASNSGNLEAGIVFDLPSGLEWPTKRSPARGISQYLPLQFHHSIQPISLAAGEPFPEPQDAFDAPPVSWLEWENGVLSTPDGSALAVEGAEGLTPCLWPAPAPSIVTLKDGGWHLPVLSQGVLVRPIQQPPGVEDILVELGSFPIPAPSEDDPVDDEPFSTDKDKVEPEGKAASLGPSRYHVREMMRLLVYLGERQSQLDPRDWQRWCRELCEQMSNLAERDRVIFTPFLQSRTNPLPILLDPRMRPNQVDAKPLTQSLAEIAQNWGLDTNASLWQNVK